MLVLLLFVVAAAVVVLQFLLLHSDPSFSRSLRVRVILARVHHFPSLFFSLPPSTAIVCIVFAGKADVCICLMLLHYHCRIPVSVLHCNHRVKEGDEEEAEAEALLVRRRWSHLQQQLSKLSVAAVVVG